MRKILVAGSTGTQGGAVVDHLLADGEWEVFGLTRDGTTERARALEGRGVTVVEGDLTDADRMAELLEGMDAVFGVTTFFEDGTETETVQGETLATAAAEAGVEHFVYSSVGSADEAGLPHFDSKAAVEAHIAGLDLPATIVRPVFFAQNFAFMMREDIEDGRLAMPLDEGVALAFVDADDIGAAVLAALNDPETFLGETVTLAGGEHTLEEFAAAFEAHLGHDVEPVRLAVEEYRGMAGDEMADMFGWFNDAGYEFDLAELRALGLDPTSFEESLAGSDAWTTAARAR